MNKSSPISMQYFIFHRAQVTAVKEESCNEEKQISCINAVFRESASSCAVCWQLITKDAPAFLDGFESLPSLLRNNAFYPTNDRRKALIVRLSK